MELVQNLLDNAVKYAKENLYIKLSTKNAGNQLKITIEDNGIGINKEYSDKVFKLFHRLNRDAGYEGTGVGLSICKNIVEKYNGKIWFESEERKGTIFYIIFPFEN